jgi:hypothetical protein
MRFGAVFFAAGPAGIAVFQGEKADLSSLYHPETIVPRDDRLSDIMHQFFRFAF